MRKILEIVKGARMVGEHKINDSASNHAVLPRRFIVLFVSSMSKRRFIWRYKLYWISLLHRVHCAVLDGHFLHSLCCEHLKD